MHRSASYSGPFSETSVDAPTSPLPLTIAEHGGHGHGNDHNHNHNHGEPTSHAKPEHSHAGRQAVGWVLLLALSVHAFIEGIALGVERGSSLLIAILAHKWIEAFSLGCAFYKSSGLSRRKIMCLLLAFCSTTPIGIGVGLALDHSLENRNIGVITALCAGSFMYVAAIHSVKDAHDHPGKTNLLQLLALVLGFGAMALISKFHD